MNLQRLWRRFRRELAANPKKAAVLAVVTLVAGYFWAPLIWKWMPGQGTPSVLAPASIMPQANAVVVPPEAGPTTSPATGPKLHVSWQQLAHWRKQDGHTTPVELPAGMRDPFAVEKPPQQQDLATKNLQPVRNVTPQELGLVLAGTLIGPELKVARVNGRSFQEGQTIRVVKGDQTFDFTLVEVQPRRIVLQRDSERFELTIKDPLQSNSIELSLQR